MKRTVVTSTAIAATVIALSFVLGSSDAQCAGKEKGEALQQLEALAGKTIEEVKVPAVPKPTPVESSYQVNGSSSSYQVNSSTSSYGVSTSTSTSQGTKP